MSAKRMIGIPREIAPSRPGKGCFAVQIFRGRTRRQAQIIGSPSPVTKAESTVGVASRPKRSATCLTHEAAKRSKTLRLKRNLWTIGFPSAPTCTEETNSGLVMEQCSNDDAAVDALWKKNGLRAPMKFDQDLDLSVRLVRRKKNTTRYGNRSTDELLAAARFAPFHFCRGKVQCQVFEVIGFASVESNQGYGTLLLQRALEALDRTGSIVALTPKQESREFYKNRGFNEWYDFAVDPAEKQLYRDLFESTEFVYNGEKSRVFWSPSNLV